MVIYKLRYFESKYTDNSLQFSLFGSLVQGERFRSLHRIAVVWLFSVEILHHLKQGKIDIETKVAIGH